MDSKYKSTVCGKYKSTLCVAWGRIGVTCISDVFDAFNRKHGK